MLSEEEKAIQFYKRFIEAEEQELEWMYKEDEEYYRDSIEQKELLIKGWRNILNLITKLQKENEEIKSKNKHLKSENDAYGNTIVKQDVEIKEKDRYIKNSEEITTEMNNDIKKLLLENKQKDKQIDLMAEFISKYHCFEVTVYDLDDECTHEHECKDCIKKYFETKSK